jgi:hypothetical protein
MTIEVLREADFVVDVDAVVDAVVLSAGGGREELEVENTNNMCSDAEARDCS